MGAGGQGGPLSGSLKSGAGHHHDTPSSSSGPSKDIGAGKLTYLLEQMKIEVEAAVSRRKEVDLQMKRLQEKNRALEEKIDEERRKRVEMEKSLAKMKERCEGLVQEVGQLRGSGGGSLGGSGPMGGKEQHQQQSLQQQQQQQQLQHLPHQPPPPHSAAASPSSTPPNPNAFPTDFLQQHHHQQQQQQQSQNPFSAPIPIAAKPGINNNSNFNSNSSSSSSNSPDDAFSSVLKPSTSSGSSISLAVPPRLTHSPGPTPGIGMSSAASTPGVGPKGNSSSSSSDPFDGLLNTAAGGGGARGRGSSDVVHGTSNSNSNSSGNGSNNTSGGKQLQQPQGAHGRRESNLV